MGMVLRLMLLVAAFAYAAMPMHGAMAVAMPSPAASGAHSGAAHSGAEMAHAGPAALHHEAMIGLANAICPLATMTSGMDHAGHGTMGGSHCGACLMLAPIIVFADAGVAVRTTETAGLAHRLESTPATPLERPPRSLR